jgi:hypothetical protein
MKNCACDYFEDDPRKDMRCDNKPTQEDLLCDTCREGCGAVLGFTREDGTVVESRHMSMPDGTGILRSLNKNVRVEQ